MNVIKESIKGLLWGALRLTTGRDLARLRVLSGPAKGVRMEFDLRKEGSYWLGSYDDWVLKRVCLDRWLKPGQVAWDCGAYIGYYTAIFRKLIGDHGQVVTFEASSANHRRVSRLPEINHWSNVIVLRQAIGPDHSVIEFVSNLGGASGPYGLSKQFAAGTSLDVEKVRCAGVDELVFEQGLPAPDFIKFDLETAEEFALHNGQQIFSTKRPLLLLELHGNAARTATGRFLEAHDYAAWDVLQLPTNTPPLRSSGDMQARPPESHTLFCMPAERREEKNGLASP